MLSRRFAIFVIAGGISALANIGSRIVLGIWLDYAASIVIAYCIGMVTAFLLMKVLVFEPSTNVLHHQVIWFTLVNLAAVLQTLFVSLLLARSIFPMIGMHWHTETVAHAIGVGVPVYTSYLGHKHLTFRRVV